MSHRKVEIPLRSKRRAEKSAYERISEKKPHGFGRKQGICTKSIDKTDPLEKFLRTSGDQIEKEAERGDAGVE